MENYRIELPHRHGVPTGQRFFDVGRYFDDETDLTRPVGALVGWAERVTSADALRAQSIRVYARVTDSAPGFGFVPTPRTLGRIAAIGAYLDVSVYTSSED